MPRQLAAIIADGCRRERLAGVKAPTLVIHGEADPLVPLAGGQDTAAHIPGAKLKTIPGMGHDLPLALVDEIADAIADHARTAETARERPRFRALGVQRRENVAGMAVLVRASGGFIRRLMGAIENAA